METITLIGGIGLTAVIWKFVDFMRLLGSFKTEQSAVTTQLLSWVGGVVAMLVYAASDFGGTVTIDGKPLSQFSTISLVLLGVMMASTASAAVDVKQAIDSRDNASKPPLL